MSGKEGNRKRRGENDGEEVDERPNKKIFQNDEEGIPDEIQVIGAGTSEANGAYSRVDDVDDAPCYVKDGTWKDQSAKFRIYRYCHDEEGGLSRWILDVGDDDIYYCHTNSSTVVPKSGWGTFFTGRSEPVPIIHYGKNYPFDWRIDPTFSQSDYTIRITTLTDNDNNTVTTDYHVHRASISLGERASGYFVNLFGCGSFTENSESMSKIELHPLAAEWFSVMLDFLYGSELRLERDNAIVLLYLARYFDCERMLREINSFCEDYMNIDLCAKFYEHATALQLDDIVDYVHKYLVDNIDSCLVRSWDEIITMTPISFWQSVVNDIITLTPDKSKGIGCVVAALCKRETEPLTDKHIFKRMTEGLTCVSFGAAATLLEYELRLVGCQDDRLSQLQAVCIDAMAEKIYRTKSSSRIPQLPRGCPAIMYNRLMEKVHSNFQAKLQTIRSSG